MIRKGLSCLFFCFFCSELFHPLFMKFFCHQLFPFPLLFMTLRRLHTHNSRDGTQSRKEKCNFSRNYEPHSTGLRFNVLSFRYLQPRTTVGAFISSIFDVCPTKKHFLFIQLESHLMQKVNEITFVKKKRFLSQDHRKGERTSFLLISIPKSRVKL